MTRQPIEITQFAARPHGLWEPGWFLLTSGNFAAGEYNTMTVSWGSLGVMWGRPFAQVVVRPQRYTFQFMEKYPTFTLCAFSREYRAALNLLGAKSGRRGNKIAETVLTPAAASIVEAPVFEQAELAIECRKLYWQDFDPSHFVLPEIDRNYPSKDYHRVYYGEVVALTGVEKYRG
jgi:flavin reductase (DIM6/NTAB) family NADH-FMN oxidoreductase RutF